MCVHPSLLDGNPRDTHNGLRSSANPLSGVISGPDQFCLFAPDVYIPAKVDRWRFSDLHNGYHHFIADLLSGHFYIFASENFPGS